MTCGDARYKTPVNRGTAMGGTSAHVGQTLALRVAPTASSTTSMRCRSTRRQQGGAPTAAANVCTSGWITGRERGGRAPRGGALRGCGRSSPHPHARRSSATRACARGSAPSGRPQLFGPHLPANRKAASAGGGGVEGQTARTGGGGGRRSSSAQASFETGTTAASCCAVLPPHRFEKRPKKGQRQTHAASQVAAGAFVQEQTGLCVVGGNDWSWAGA